MEPFGTNWLVSKPDAVKFYVPPELMRECERIFERQGVKLSEGITRLIRLLVEAPEEMRVVLLGQAHGDAMQALAMSVLSRREEGGSKVEVEYEQELEVRPRKGPAHASKSERRKQSQSPALKH